MNTRTLATIAAVGSVLGFFATTALPQVKRIPYSAPQVTVIVSGSLYYQDLSPDLDDPLAGIVVYYISNGEDGSANEARVLKGTTYYKTTPDTLVFTPNEATDTLYVFAIDPIRTNNPVNPLMGKYTISVNGVEDSITSANVLYFLECGLTDVGNQGLASFGPVKKIPYNSSPVTAVLSGSLYYQDISPAHDDPFAGVMVYYISNGEDGSANEARVLKGTTYYKTTPDTLVFTSNEATDTLYVFAIDPLLTNSPENPLMGEYTISVNGVEDSITSANVLYFLECGTGEEPISWLTTTVAFDACGDTLRPVFGQAPFATNCIDSLYGEAELPPPPPAGGFDARFLLPCGSSASLRDFRSDANIEQRWVLKLQACSGPITLKWDTTGFPDGCLYIRDAFGGILVDVNMRTQTELTVPLAITELWIERSEEVCRTITTHAGWNMLSVPAHVSPNHYLNVLPDAASHPFRFTPSGYVSVDTLRPGIGYWVKFDGIHSYNVCGCSDVEKSVSVLSGWNMIGPFEDVVLVSGITSSPGGIVVSPFYHYFPPYGTVDTLYPGMGYWVKASQNGTLYLGSNDSSLARSVENWTLEVPPSPPGVDHTSVLLPIEFSLDQNYPNPFNPSTAIRYALPVSGAVTLTIYDQLGREVRTLVNEVQNAGFRSVEWNSHSNSGIPVASGVYFYRLQAGDFVETKKLVLLR